MERDEESSKLKGVDTNVLVRHIVRDHAEQAQTATAFVAARTSEDPAYVSLVVLAELVWTLRRQYGYSSQQVHSLLIALLETVELSFEEEYLLISTFSGLRAAKGDIADHLIALCGVRAGCDSIVTFDRRAANAIPAMELLA